MSTLTSFATTETRPHFWCPWNESTQGIHTCVCQFEVLQINSCLKSLRKHGSVPSSCTQDEAAEEGMTIRDADHSGKCTSDNAFVESVSFSFLILLHAQAIPSLLIVVICFVSRFGSDVSNGSEESNKEPSLELQGKKSAKKQKSKTPSSIKSNKKSSKMDENQPPKEVTFHLSALETNKKTSKTTHLLQHRLINMFQLHQHQQH